MKTNLCMGKCRMIYFKAMPLLFYAETSRQQLPLSWPNAGHPTFIISFHVRGRGDMKAMDASMHHAYLKVHVNFNLKIKDCKATIKNTF